MSMPENNIQFILDDRIISLDFKDGGAIRPDTNLLGYLRISGHSSVKEGCGEGDCGACTVVIAEAVHGELSYKAINACLVFLPMIHGCQVITTENLSFRQNGKLQLHPVQQALVDHHGSQCGYCTPGIVMSLFALWKNHSRITPALVKERLAGNLCRCTGYQPIIDAIVDQSGKARHDHFNDTSEKITKDLISIQQKSGDIVISTSGLLYLKPASLREALKLRKKYPEATMLSGATDIAVMVNKRKQEISAYLDISSLMDLKFIIKGDKYISLGSCVSIHEMGEGIKDDFPALFDMIGLFGSHQIRNLATPGGNIASASPIGDLIPVLMAYGCELELQNQERKRTMPLEHFIKGYHSTEMEEDELITALILPYPNKNKMIRSYKVSKRKDVDISTVSSAFLLSLDKSDMIQEAKLFFGGMAATTIRAVETEDYLMGKKWTEELAVNASGIIRTEFEPISDARSAAESRKIMAGNLLIRFWEDTEK
ncbi:MAG: xanthine dehydrogenase small subunit [Bacteroidales bacterium]|nr:xanthine dehydrogenase small subunit [Bacteroidales bacterium]